MKKKVLSIFLVMVMVLSLVPMTVFAENTPTSVDTEAALRTALDNGESVKLAANITLTSDLVIKKEVCIDLNGYTIDGEPIYKANDHTDYDVTILDSKGGGKIVCYVYTGGEGNLVIQGGIFSEEIQGGNNYNREFTRGSLIITNGTFSNGFKCSEHVEISGGTFSGVDTARDGITIRYPVNLVDIDSKISGGIFNCNVLMGGYRTTYAPYKGGIRGGTFNKKVYVTFRGCVYDGIFNDEVTFDSKGKITGGTFNKAVISSLGAEKLAGTIEGGTFKATVTNGEKRFISGGDFSGTVTNESGGTISGGDFSGTVTNESGGTISGGTFKNTVINNGTITDGTFNKEVKNNGTISGGTFNDVITGTGSIYSGTFYSSIKEGMLYAKEGSFDDIVFEGDGKIDGHTVTYKIEGKDYAKLVLQNSDKARKPINPTKNGYILSDWYTDPECSKVFDFETTPVTTDMTLYAKWIERSDFTVEYDTAGGSTIENKTDVKWTAKVTEIITPPTRDGYKLTGWKCGDEDVDKNMTYADLVGVDTVMSVKLTAQWKDIASPVISGIKDGKSYGKAQTVTVIDENLNTVTLNGEAVTLDENGQFVLSPADGEQKIIATDKEGNKTEVTVTINDGHTFGEWKTTKSATFFKDGVETRTCINEGCAETETRVVLSKFSEFKSGLFGVDFLKAILTVFADLLTSVC